MESVEDKDVHSSNKVCYEEVLEGLRIHAPEVLVVEGDFGMMPKET